MVPGLYVANDAKLNELSSNAKLSTFPPHTILNPIRDNSTTRLNSINYSFSDRFSSTQLKKKHPPKGSVYILRNDMDWQMREEAERDDRPKEAVLSTL